MSSLPVRKVSGNESGDGTDRTTPGATTLVMEAVRAASADHKPHRSDEERISWFWRLFGGTILSIVALIAVTIFNSMSNSITELRGEIRLLNDLKAEAVRKDEVSALRTQVLAHAAYRIELDSLKERASKHRTELEESKKEINGNIDGLKKDAIARSDAFKKDVAVLEHLRERVTTLELLKKDIAALEAIKERQTNLAADVKTIRDDVGTLKQEVTRNQAGDMERKDRRDTQMKQLEETFKELQKQLLEAREKIARLEGQVAPKPNETSNKPKE